MAYGNKTNYTIKDLCDYGDGKNYDTDSYILTLIKAMKLRFSVARTLNNAFHQHLDHNTTAFTLLTLTKVFLSIIFMSSSYQGHLTKIVFCR